MCCLTRIIPRLFPLRVLPALLLFAATFAHYFARVNVNIAIISMTEDSTGACHDRANQKLNDGNHTIFCWSEDQKSLVKGAFYYGYILLQVPGGRLAESVGSRLVLGYATLASSLLTLATPLLALHAGLEAVVTVRVLIGLAQGVLFPCINPIVVRWAFKSEQGKFTALSSMGGTFGTVFIYPICGYLLKYFDWQTVFYVSGLAGLLWCFAWFLLVTDNPEDHPYITRVELGHIIKNRPKSKFSSPSSDSLFEILPQLFKSPCILALMLCSFANDWGLYMILTEGPNFISNVLKKDVATIGLLSSAPYFGRFLCAQVSAFLADKLIAERTMSVLNVRRLCFSVAYLSPALGLLLMGYLDTNWVACIVVMTVCFSLNGFNVPALVNILDVAPSLSGTVTGVTNGFSASAGFLVPLVVAATTGDVPGEVLGWRKAFKSGVMWYCVSLVGFYTFGSAEPGKFDRSSCREREEEQVVLEENCCDRN